MLRTARSCVVAMLVIAAAVTGSAPALTAPAVFPGPVPRAQCGPGSNPETGLQGRLSAADAAGPGKNGFWCNMKMLSHFGAKGGYKVERYVDKAGHECAIYDSTLLFPKDAVAAGQDLTGAYILDMSDPSKPVHTATLSTLAMQTPHESMSLNQKRGLLAAVAGNVEFAPGVVDVYDLTQDCRHPTLDSSEPTGILGHESAFALDGNTFYASSLDGPTTTAVDTSNPTVTTPVWGGQFNTHGMSVSNDGNRLYMAVRETRTSGPAPGLMILDVSEIQARKANPQVRVISTLTWPNKSTPQIPIPITIKGHPYLVEIDEFGSGDKIGAARIIDIADETKPYIVSNIRLQVNMPQYQGGNANDPNALANDPGAQSLYRGYEGHYCEVPQRADPGVVACTFILSGLRLFDIRDPFNPREIAYFNGPPTAGSATDNNVDPTKGGSNGVSNFAMSKPAFVPSRGEVWYTDGNSGFYALKVTNGVWPFGTAAATTTQPQVMLPNTAPGRAVVPAMLAVLTLVGLGLVSRRRAAA